MPSPQKNYQGGGITLEVSDVTFMCRWWWHTPWLLYLSLKLISNGGVIVHTSYGNCLNAPQSW